MERPTRRVKGDEMLFLGGEHAHEEEYLEGLAMLEAERADGLVGISDVARALKVRPPSAWEMLRRLAKTGHVEYVPRRGVRLTPAGREIGLRMVRYGRLMEVFIVRRLRAPGEMAVAHAVEHGMTERFATALCGFLGHPRRCPHGHDIPPGSCCPRLAVRRY